ncbi:MAG: response regulator [Bacteroidaceae bacterium]|nr:response regulator [Bacteroidaceae bacterium]
MKKVLIVEDEKMIRQGIRTMVQRSGVPVEEILDCSNGLLALEILAQNQIDLMFTDIRMPKMDGIELVREIKNRGYDTEIVAISGFDDFNYAVEMLRNGVREYILKPVERQKIAEILAKADEELTEKNKRVSTDLQIGIAQIKHIMSDVVSDDELSLLESKYAKDFFTEGYYVVVSPKEGNLETSERVIAINDFKHCNLFVVEPMILKSLKEGSFVAPFSGISRLHTGIRELKEAYLEAFAARKRSFFSQEEVVSFEETKVRVTKALLEQEKVRVDKGAWAARLNLVGTDHTEELAGNWNGLFEAMKRGHIACEDFEEGLHAYFESFRMQYKNTLSQEDERILYQLSNIYVFTNLEEYQGQLLDFLFEIQSRVVENACDSKNLAKLKKAVAFIDENYDKDLNMAVVSNEISMNYSLFSFSFKQYTGKNFVTYLRDIRMEKAKLLLAETDLKVIDISRQIGYDNEKHFMKVFKSVYGVSPSEFRKLKSVNN